MTVDIVATICAELADAGQAAADAAGAFAHAEAIARRLLPLGSADDVHAAARAAVAHVHGLGPLQPFLADPEVNEIMVNNGGDVWVERNGAMSLAGRLGAEVTPRLIERILTPVGRRLDRLSPIVDARLADGSRVCAVIPPVAIDGACLSLRRFALRRRSITEFAGDDVSGLIEQLILSRCNVLISGATSSGKTSLLNAMTSLVDAGERIITLEDTAELRIDAAHVLRLEARPASVDGVAAVTMTDLVRTCLRLRPDRMVIGEVRGAEVIDMLQALNTGHRGSLATVHANGPADALRRVEALVIQHAPRWPIEAVRDHLRASLDAIVHVSRSPAGTRSVSDVLELGPPGVEVAHRELVTGGAIVGELQRSRS